MYRYIVIVDHLGSMDGPCYIQNRALKVISKGFDFIKLK